MTKKNIYFVSKVQGDVEAVDKNVLVGFDEVITHFVVYHFVT